MNPLSRQQPLPSMLIAMLLGLSRPVNASWNPRTRAIAKPTPASFSVKGTRFCGVSVAHESLGALEFVMKIEISAKRKLTREDPVVVMGNQETRLRFAMAAVGPIRCEFAQGRRVPKTLSGLTLG